MVRKASFEHVFIDYFALIEHYALSFVSTFMYSFQVEVMHIAQQTESNWVYHRAWMTVTGKSRVIINVKACSHVGIALSTIPRDHLFETYLIEIQKTMTTTSIIDPDGVVTEVQSQDLLLECAEYKALWIDWSDNRLSLGQGPDYGVDEVIGVPIPEDYRPNGLGVHSFIGGSDWYFLREAGKVYMCQTVKVIYHMANYEYLQIDL